MYNYVKYSDLVKETYDEDEEKKPDITINIGTVQEKQNIIMTNRIVIVYIYGTWCNPCSSIAGLYNSLVEKYQRPGLCMLIKEDVDKKLTQNIHNVPTFQFYIDGKLQGSIVGSDNLEDIIRDLVDQAIGLEE